MLSSLNLELSADLTNSFCFSTFCKVFHVVMPPHFQDPVTLSIEYVRLEDTPIPNFGAGNKPESPVHLDFSEKSDKRY